jgi:hypothetical protein
MTQRKQASESDEQAALLAALRAVLRPLAELAIAQGLAYPALEEMVKQAVVDVADRAHADQLPHRRVSRVSTTTGINRREVTRLIQVLREGRAGRPPQRHSLATEVFARWLTNPKYCDRRGLPRALPRQAGAQRKPSFEALAQSVTRDVHPRSLLDELVRLNLAEVNPKNDSVKLVRDAFVPRGDMVRMLRVLGSNVGDHFAAAVANVLADGTKHFEQAVFADGLTQESIKQAHRLVQQQWQTLLQAAVPELEAMVERDRKTGAATRRLRLGLFSFDEDSGDENQD